MADENFTVFSGVYPPSEDTYLLLDSLEICPDDAFLEVGCGSGLITLNAAKITRSVVSVDSSLEAVRNTVENLKRNGVYDSCHVLESDLLCAISSSHKFSMIVFNPPYLPADEEHTDLDHALIGGDEGTEITQRFVRQASKHLMKDGLILVVVSNLANIDAIRTEMIECGLNIEVASEKSLFFEKIQVLRGILKDDHKETVL
ncbi:MAG: HemK2/MTQ2 family protein methyltransferase [Candidatus Thorarchaeota archaeon]